jgi:hypothetical protein
MKDIIECKKCLITYNTKTAKKCPICFEKKKKKNSPSRKRRDKKHWEKVRIHGQTKKILAEEQKINMKKYSYYSRAKRLKVIGETSADGVWVGEIDKENDYLNPEFDKL